MLRLILVIVNVIYCFGIEVPDFIHICKLNDPEFNNCMIQSAHDLRPILAKGAEEYNIPSLEPLYMDHLISEHSGALHISATDVKAYGASNFYVKDIKIDLDRQRYDINVDLPNLLIKCKYGVDGKILLLPIKGNGPMTANVTDIKAKVVLQGETVDKDNEKYLKFNTMTLKVKIGGGTGRLENLFNGDKILGELVNETIDKNFDAFLRELLPIIEKSLAVVFLKIANNIVEPYTLNQLFPTD